MQLNRSQIREETDSMKQEQGFSLIELLIVVAIIAIIAAIAVPSMLQARMAANESGAIQGCRTVGSAEMSYAAINNQTYTDISTLATKGYLDDRFGGTPAKFSGYTYADSSDSNIPGMLTNPSGFGADATPDANLGRFIYGIGPDQVVRYLGTITSDAMVCGASDCNPGEPIGTQHGS
jgi:type IV pilus assembly protein PilA